MPILTAVNLPGVFGLHGIDPAKEADLIDYLNDMDNSVSISIKPTRNEAWLLLDSAHPFDPAALINGLVGHTGINPTIRAEVAYERESDGSRRAAHNSWQSNTRSLPEVLKDEFTWYGPGDGVWAKELYSNKNTLPSIYSESSAHPINTNQYQINLVLEPILYHKLNVVALENGQSLEDFVMQCLEERADGKPFC